MCLVSLARNAGQGWPLEGREKGRWSKDSRAQSEIKDFRTVMRGVVSGGGMRIIGEEVECDFGSSSSQTEAQMMLDNALVPKWMPSFVFL